MTIHNIHVGVLILASLFIALHMILVIREVSHLLRGWRPVLRHTALSFVIALALAAAFHHLQPVHIA